MFKNNSTKTILLAGSLALSWSLVFTATIPMLKIAPPATNVFIQFLLAAIFMLLLFGRNAFSLWKQMSKSDKALAVSSSLAYCLFVFFHAYGRTMFAPPGSDVAFLLSAVPLFAVIMNSLKRREDRTFGKYLGLLSSLLGVAAMVANWESPSSFSPFSRYIDQELLILASALGAASYFILSKNLVKNYSVTAVITLQVTIALPVLLGLAFFSDDLNPIILVAVNNFPIYSAASILMIVTPALLILKMVDTVGVAKATSSLFLMPVIVTFFVGVDKLFGLTKLPTPFDWVSMIISMLIILLGIIAVWRER